MKLSDILSVYHTDPKESRKYAKEICSNLRGTVQKNFGSKMVSLLFSVLIASQLLFISGVFGMLLMISVTMGLVVWNMYNFSWKLTFDGATGFFSFHTMFKGTIRFHVSEIGRIRTVTTSNKGERTECLCIPVDNIKIMVVLRKYYLIRPRSENNYRGCDTNAEKLEQYLTLYQHFLADDGNFNVMDDSLSPAVRKAIAEQRRMSEGYIPKQVNVPTEIPSIPENSSTPEIPATSQKPETPVKLEKSAPEKIDLSKSTAPIPTELPKAQDSAFPDPAMKKDVDADALFNSVLNQFGKSPVSSSSKSTKDVDALFDNVLKQFGKK